MLDCSGAWLLQLQILNGRNYQLVVKRIRFVNILANNVRISVIGNNVLKLTIFIKQINVLSNSQVGRTVSSKGKLSDHNINYSTVD